ncbi:SusD/RagB family nutrient-binding outer membrane lipoprotein [Allomuricauda sp. F6463D]|uniref:SusD/RagB family nutrient-binding outer membrane lipoprotein n=1 Tax=Allomuricauda sp. F6463D TaxID=2926409 RepID=UPI001FF36193|nr:SusD/RagB family nutrient-binding outer membrane lipoprotein [Muricauda sp. F6463D]MCK0159111.1 SusD/RagB family nutrient-binding outer membrane lipoprotein [Muricauda sp. F6463D]
MKSTYIKFLLIFTTITFLSCEKLVDDLNENPNQLTLNDIDPGLFLNGAELSNIAIQLGPYSRMAGYWSGQLIGFEQVDLERFQYNVANNTFDWDGYQSVLTPLRNIQERTTDNPLLLGISKVVEAHLVGTYASLFGDIPYSEALGEIENPKFDDQIVIFEQLQLVLDEAIIALEVAQGFGVLEDYIFQGDRIKWLESAWTLKARYYMHTKEYGLAYNAALNGISSSDNNMMFNPLDVTGQNATKNKYYIVLAGGPNVGTGDSYLMQLLDGTSSISRNNAKTDETARRQYYIIDQSDADGNLGVAQELEPQPMITYQENLLILAESGTRTQGFNVGLGHLNQLRDFLNTGNFLNSNFVAEPYVYESYVSEDFDAGGMENVDNIEPERALLREIVEERYVTGFTTYMPFDDARRLKKEDSDIAVPFPLNVPTSTQNVERMLYPQDEVLSNPMAPTDPGLYAPTRVNQ